MTLQPNESHTGEFLRYCFCHMTLRLGTERASNPEILMGADNKNPSKFLLSLAKGPEKG